MVGVGGPCDVCMFIRRRRGGSENISQPLFPDSPLPLEDDPPVSYWCSQNPSGGGAFAFRVPQGFWTPNQLPHTPYKDVSQAIANVWRPSRWEVYVLK